jgi:5-methylcytosine-specific restriction endonuclease McrA
VDHITPVLFGGTDDESNLQASCARCNLGKGAR